METKERSTKERPKNEAKIIVNYCTFWDNAKDELNLSVKNETSFLRGTGPS